MDRDRFDRQRLQRLLGTPELGRLVTRLRRRLERGRPLTGELRLAQASAEERRAIEGLLGRAPGRGATVGVDLEALAHVLRGAGAARDLASAVEGLIGPVTDRNVAATRHATAWSELWTREAPAAEKRGLKGYLEDLRSSGLLRRLAGDAQSAGALLDGVWRIVDVLPADGLTLSTLAARHVGDAHGLDTGRPLATLVRRAILTRYPEVVADSDDANGLWAAVGVRVGGGLRSCVAVFNLPVEPSTATGRALAALTARAEPAWLTLRQLLDDAPAWAVAGRPVFVCENVAVVAEAADRLGARSQPLVATDGQASGAAVTLLRQLRAAAGALRYHGDFDWGGVHIGNRVIGELGAAPWRFDARAYVDALDRHGGRPLTGRPAEARWDADLTRAMQSHGQAIDEERVIDDLLADLAIEVTGA